MNATKQVKRASTRVQLPQRVYSIYKETAWDNSLRIVSWSNEGGHEFSQIRDLQVWDY
jgi:hypothetical protein